MVGAPPVCKFGWKAPGFALPGVDGRRYRYQDIAGPKGTLVMFICNHCPYVLKALDRIIRDAAELTALGIGVVAISANDAEAYPQDGFAQMKALATERGFAFPYLYDESQGVARAYGAACTPDFFGFDASGGLQYRGRLEGPQPQAGLAEPRRELYEALKQVAKTGHGPREQFPAMGCSIKWKAG
ncbi:thioredoxin family protein [Salipiger sp. 1_MG-2023]|uniref:thioredoxin family protein n=1 Tax=Salipiger sp. 1_MG-2023 TaxID=3062665 RepID=UPI0026E1240C|nr:thioredoxin family protein [Salipiger sp. 1_MG-2023]MDO6584034.1 thioredoxin family protein [Salipiger sp. 1_MG-2023]